MEPLVTTAWLAGELARAALKDSEILLPVGSIAADRQAGNLILFDATKYLPNENKDGREKFAQAHIQGAHFFDIDEVADPDTDLPHMVPSPSRFARLLSAYGVTNDSRIVFYDQKGLASAARGWWMMGLFGHDRVAVLDGGLPKWIAEGRPVRSGATEAPEILATAAKFRASFRPTRLRGIGDMIVNLETKAELVLDARASGRFAGTAPEPRAGVRAGHIPGSVSLPYTELLGPDQTFTDKETLRARFSQAGIDGSRPVVTTCGTGVTAAILTLGMRLAGLPEGALYDGSWTEYGGREDTEVATGAKPATPAQAAE